MRHRRETPVTTIRARYAAGPCTALSFRDFATHSLVMGRALTTPPKHRAPGIP